MSHPYVPTIKPTVTGPVNGNVFNVIAVARVALRRAKLPDAMEEMTTRATSSKSYDEALAVISEYVDFDL